MRWAHNLVAALAFTGLSTAGAVFKRQVDPTGAVSSVIAAATSTEATSTSTDTQTTMTTTAAATSTSSTTTSGTTTTATTGDVTVTVTAGGSAKSTVTASPKTLTVTVVATVTEVTTKYATSTVTSSGVATATETVYVTSTVNAKRGVAVPTAIIRRGLEKRATVTQTITASGSVVTVTPTSTTTVRRTSTVNQTSTSTILSTTFLNAETTITVTSTIVETIATITATGADSTVTGTDGAAASTSSASSSSGESDSNDSSGLSTGAKVGIGIGVGVGGLLVLSLLAWFIIRRRRDRVSVSHDEINAGQSEVPVGGYGGYNSINNNDTFTQQFPSPQSANAAAALGINRPNSNSPLANKFAPSPVSSPSPGPQQTNFKSVSPPPGMPVSTGTPPPHTTTPPPAGYVEMGADERLELGDGTPRVHHPNAAEIDSRPVDMSHQSGPVPEVYEMPAEKYN